jgi:hypothetical protein
MEWELYGKVCWKTELIIFVRRIQTQNTFWTFLYGRPIPGEWIMNGLLKCSAIMSHSTWNKYHLTSLSPMLVCTWNTMSHVAWLQNITYAKANYTHIAQKLRKCEFVNTDKKHWKVLTAVLYKPNVMVLERKDYVNRHYRMSRIWIRIANVSVPPLCLYSLGSQRPLPAETSTFYSFILVLFCAFVIPCCVQPPVFNHSPNLVIHSFPIHNNVFVLPERVKEETKKGVK